MRVAVHRVDRRETDRWSARDQHVFGVHRFVGGVVHRQVQSEIGAQLIRRLADVHQRWQVVGASPRTDLDRSPAHRDIGTSGQSIPTLATYLAVLRDSLARCQTSHPERLVRHGY
jgi:hypothetical protein